MGVATACEILVPPVHTASYPRRLFFFNANENVLLHLRASGCFIFKSNDSHS